MQLENPNKSRILKPLSRPALTTLVQEAGALQAASQQIALLGLAARLQGCATTAGHSQLRGAVRDFLDTLSRLRNCGADLLSGCDPDLSKIMTQAFTRDIKDIYNCFESMARDVSTVIGHGRMPSDAALSELVNFVVHQVTDANNAVAAAARLIADTACTDAESLAVTDQLTGLPNRRALQEYLMQKKTAASHAEPVAIMHIDLDNFKKVNDSMGHAAGDTALQHAANAMALHLEENDFLARLGGDEFALVLFGSHSEAALSKRAEQLIESVSVPFSHGGKRSCIAASIGIAANSSFDDAALDRCMINADLALYQAKHAGRGTYHFFTPTLRTQRQQKEDLENEIRFGLDAQQFEPFFQPQVEGRTGKIVGLEALVRWHHPTRGILTPYHFLEAAQDAKVMDLLDQYIMERTFGAFKSWLNDGLQIPQVSINLTGSRLLEVDLVETMLRAVSKAQLQSSMIGIEILESAMIDDASQQMMDNILRLAEAGFKLELDDFGTGHASISNLRNFKVDRIKIDRSFVKDVHLYPELSKITSAMIGLAHSLRIDALAEGVETPEERLVLNALGCDHFQGYGVSRPMPGAEIPLWIRRTQNQKELPPGRP